MLTGVFPYAIVTNPDPIGAEAENLVIRHEQRYLL